MHPTLIRDEPTWGYLPPNGIPTNRRLRVWRTDVGRLVAVITEDGDGTSITNAAAQVAAQIAAQYPDDVTTIIEHYPPTGDGRGPHAEHFDEVRIMAATPDGKLEPQWRRLPIPDVIRLLNTDPRTGAVPPGGTPCSPSPHG